MRNEAMEQLDVLAGSWRTTMRNAWFLEPADQRVPGSATVEWLGDAFVVFRWTMGGDVGPATSEMVLVLGRSDARDAYTALYHDERGVCRIFAMTFDGSHWNLTRETPTCSSGSSLTSSQTGSRAAGRRLRIADQRGAKTSTSSLSERSNATCVSHRFIRYLAPRPPPRADHCARRSAEDVRGRVPNGRAGTKPALSWYDCRMPAHRGGPDASASARRAPVRPPMIAHSQKARPAVLRIKSRPAGMT
jgi:hypothetical protein